MANAKDEEKKKLLEILVKNETLSSDDFRSLVTSMDNFDVVAKAFLLQGIPFVFSSHPMRYLIFREQVADRFQIGYQDVCIVGSARLGFSPAHQKFGKPFHETSDVDVVVISGEMFDRGTHEIFHRLNSVGPQGDSESDNPVTVNAKDWNLLQKAIRNFVYENVNPAHLSEGSALRKEIFSKITSTSALFLALEPQVFVSKIRCRIFRHWRAAEAYYSNSLRILKRKLTENGGSAPDAVSVNSDDDDDTDSKN